jgi:hypothetical protein
LRSYLRLTGGTVLVALLAFLAGTADGASQPKRVAFRVTLEATVTKDWNALTETTENGCPTVRRSIGRRTVRLRSRRPTTVLVTFDRGRVSYAPAVVRFVAGELVQTGNRATSVKAPCAEHTARARCARRRRAVTGASFGFFRSAHDEISVRARRLPDLPRGCPPESSEVRGIQPGLDEAQGELSEAALANSRIRIQTAIDRHRGGDDRPRGPGDGPRRRARALDADVHSNALGIESPLSRKKRGDTWRKP